MLYLTLYVYNERFIFLKFFSYNTEWTSQFESVTFSSYTSMIP